MVVFIETISAFLSTSFCQNDVNTFRPFGLGVFQWYVAGN